MFHFMPFQSVVVEIHHGTNANWNSKNFVKHINEGKYMTINASMQGKSIDKEQVWRVLKEAIEAWHALV